MIVKIDYKIGQPIYLKHDPEQNEYRLNRIFISQKGLLALEILTWDGELIEIDEIHCSKDKNILRAAGVDENGEEN